MRTVLVSLLLVAVLRSPVALGQDDASELAKLKQHNELLEAKLEAALLKIEKLEKELADSKVKGKAIPSNKKAEEFRSLRDVMVEEALVAGDWRNNADANSKGEWSLLVTERAGDKLKGRFSVQAERVQDSVPILVNLGTYDVEGRVTDNSLSFNTVNAAKLAAVANGKVVKGLLTLDYQTANGVRSTLKAVVK